MKRISLYPLALSALLYLAGCADEDSFGPSSVRGDNSLLAVIEGQETDVVSRTAVDETGRVTWIATDALGVYAAHTENALFSSTGSGASVVFKGNLSPADDAAEWAYYPYDANAVVNGQTLSFTLPDEYTYTGNSHAPMLAVKGSEGNFEFKHLCGLLRITLGGGMPADADRFVITSVGDDAPALSGVATVSDVMATNATLALPKEGGRTITYTLGALSSAEELQHFFVPLPVGSYPRLQVAFYLKDKSEPEFTRTLSGLQVRRAVMTCMPILDWRTGEQFVLNENTIEITDALAKHVSVSPENNTTLLYKATAADDVPSVGNVVWSRVSDDFPYGFLGKVTKVTANGDGSYTVETGVASLSEAFDELCIEETVELTPEGTPSLQSRGLEAGYLENGKFSTSVELEIKEEPKGSPFYVSGKAGIGAEVTASIYLSKNKVDNTFFKVEADAIQKGEIGMHIQYDDENEILKKKLAEIRFMNIPLGGGLIQLTPTMAPYFHIKAKGEINNKLNFSSKTKCIYHGQYIDGRGWTAKKEEQPSASKDTPWSLGGSLDFSGELTVGLSNKFSLKLYNRDDMSVYIEPEIGAKLKGEISINDTNSTSLEQILKDAKLETYFYMGGSIGFNASLITPDDFEEKLTIEAVKFCKREIPLLRSMDDLSAQVNESGKADVSMEANGEQLINEAQVSIALVDNSGEIIETGQPVECNAATEKEDPEEEKIPVETTFENIKEGVEYKSFPIIQSPVLEDLAPEGKVELKSLEVSFKASGSLRDQLAQIYKDTNGDNWTNNENWCTDEPIENWYGVARDNSGKYILQLANNNLTGDFSLSSSEVVSISVEKNELTSINVSGCTNLISLAHHENPPLTLLDVSNCNSILIGSSSFSDSPQLKTFRARQNSQIKWLNFEETILETLDLEGCEKLQFCGYPNEKTLRFVNLRGCNSWEDNLLTRLLEQPIEILDISDIEDVWQTGITIPATLEELYVNNCNSVKSIGHDSGKASTNNLKILEAKNCTNLSSVYIVDNQVTSLDVEGSPVEDVYFYHVNTDTKQNDMRMNISGCSNLKSLTCNYCRLTELDLSDCAELTRIELNGNRLSTIDVSSCDALEVFYCSGNPLHSLDVSKNKNLKVLLCKENWNNPNLDFTSLILNNPELTELQCGYLGLTSLDLSNCKSLENVYCENNQLQSLNVSGCTSLQSIRCENNQLQSLDVSGCTSLYNIYCQHNQLTELYMDQCNALTGLICGNNQLRSLDVADFTELGSLYCQDNLIETLNIKGLSKLKDLSCGNNNIKTLDATGCIGLETLSANPTKELILNGCQSLKKISSGTPLEVLDLTGCVGLTDIYLRNVQFSSLDISDCVSLQTLDCAENTSLTALIFPDSGLPDLSKMVVQNTRITKEIPDWLTLTSGYYEQRYNYSSLTGEYTDKGYGWWYPGEPDSGAHRR